MSSVVSLRKNTVAIVGVEFGDEGKGRLVDNKIDSLLKKSSINKVYIIRFAGGNNAGHTVDNGKHKLGLHQLPSCVLHSKTVGILDRGMCVNVDDLIAEIKYVESKIGKVRSKLILSSDAILNTDLDRAEEVLNRVRSGGSSGGGTSRGISPSYAHHYDRLGFHIHDLFTHKWKDKFLAQYSRYQREFVIYGLNLAQVEVPDFKTTKFSGVAAIRKVGSKKAFIERLEKARSELVKRKLVKDTFPIHKKIFTDKSIGVLFEGAQALGLHPWLGKRPDVTSSDTSVYGIVSSTAFWKPEMIEEKIGVFKATYTSVSGALLTPTKVENSWAKWIREEAYEYGTTTGRPRDILYLDMPLLNYNSKMSGINSLAATHLDIARDNEEILVCTDYVRSGKIVDYQPGLWHLKGVKPKYTILESWDGKKVQNAKTKSDLPKASLQFIKYIEKQTGFLISIVTTGPKRENIIYL